MQQYRSAKLPEVISVSEIMSLFTTCFDTSGIVKNRCESYPYVAMIYTAEGRVRFRIGEREITVGSGELIFYPPGVAHSILETEGKIWQVSFLTFKCESKLCESLFYRTFSPDASLLRKIKELFDFGSPLFYNLPPKGDKIVGMYCRGDELSLMYLKSRLEGILTTLYLAVNQKNEFDGEGSVFYSAVEVMKKRFGENLTLNDIAESVGVSVSTLKKAFLKESGGGVNHYYIKMKLSRAAEMLSSSSLSVCEIAERVGFASQFYFSEQFKKNYGIPPLEYRKKQRENCRELM